MISVDDLKILKKVITYERKKIQNRIRYTINKSCGINYYQENKDKIQIYNSINKEKIYERNKLNYLKNKKVRNEKSRIYARNNQDKRKDYLMKNKKRIAETHNQYIKNRKETDLNFRLTVLVRSRISNALSGKFKSGSSIDDLGCSMDEFVSYIERKFPDGMNWGNYGKCGWHLDHVKPLSLFNLEDREEFLKACHYSNYQPLWAKDNLRKNNKLDYKLD